jgi:hypothetical protein
MADMVRKPENTGRKQAGRFKPGRSGNPAGKPKGARNKATLVLEAILDGDAPELMRTAVAMAKTGDQQMMRLCLERLIPPRKDRPVQFELPPVNNSADAAQAMLAIVRATANGEISPCEASEVSRVIQNFSEVLKTNELEQRIAALETKQ